MLETPELIMVRGYWQTKEGLAWHRLVYRKHFGSIPKGWHVHHIDGVRENNDPENLIAIPEKLHSDIHRKGKPLPSRKEIDGMLAWMQLPSSEKKRLKRLESIASREARKSKKKQLGSDKQKLEIAYGPYQIKRYEYEQPKQEPLPVLIGNKRKFEPKSIRRPAVL